MNAALVEIDLAVVDAGDGGGPHPGKGPEGEESANFGINLFIGPEQGPRLSDREDLRFLIGDRGRLHPLHWILRQPALLLPPSEGALQIGPPVLDRDRPVGKPEEVVAQFPGNKLADQAVAEFRFQIAQCAPHVLDVTVVAPDPFHRLQVGSGRIAQGALAQLAQFLLLSRPELKHLHRIGLGGDCHRLLPADQPVRR